MCYEVQIIQVHTSYHHPATSISGWVLSFEERINLECALSKLCSLVGRQACQAFWVDQKTHLKSIIFISLLKDEFQLVPVSIAPSQVQSLPKSWNTCSTF